MRNIITKRNWQFKLHFLSFIRMGIHGYRLAEILLLYAIFNILVLRQIMHFWILIAQFSKLAATILSPIDYQDCINQYCTTAWLNHVFYWYIQSETIEAYIYPMHYSHPNTAQHCYKKSAFCGDTMIGKRLRGPLRRTTTVAWMQ